MGGGGVWSTCINMCEVIVNLYNGQELKLNFTLQENGPLGPMCDTNRCEFVKLMSSKKMLTHFKRFSCFRSRWGEIDCYDSCGGCNPSSGCQWTTCYDDVAFTEAVIDEVVSQFSMF